MISIIIKKVKLPMRKRSEAADSRIANPLNGTKESLRAVEDQKKK